MSRSTAPTGLIPILATPFTENGELVLPSPCSLVEYGQRRIRPHRPGTGRDPARSALLAAASQPAAPATDLTDAQWRSALDNTLDTAFYSARAALRVMGSGSGIVAITSVNATLAAPWLAGYAAAKAGVEGLVRQLALEYGPRGIRVNAVAPGIIGSADLPHDGDPLGRVGDPAEVAAAVRFLATAGFITGVVLPVDGGISIASPSAFLRPDLRARWLED